MSKTYRYISNADRYVQPWEKKWIGLAQNDPVKLARELDDLYDPRSALQNGRDTTNGRHNLWESWPRSGWREGGGRYGSIAYKKTFRRGRRRYEKTLIRQELFEHYNGCGERELPVDLPPV